MNKQKYCIFLSLFVLTFFITENVQAMIVEQLGIYDTYQLAPEMGNTKINPEGSQVLKVDRKKGYYSDGRNQIDKHAQILPPNPDKIPTEPHPTRCVEPFESYYDRNVKGERRSEYMTPVIPNYNRHYSERRNTPYTRQEYIDVWCRGTKDYEKGLCITDKDYIYFVRAINWTWGITQMPFQNKKAKKLGKVPALFIMVDELGLDAQYVHDVKEMADLFNIKLFIGTIDSFIENSWVP